VAKYSYGLLLALALLVAVPFEGTRGLYETSEGRYAEVAREMRETGSYLEPTLDYRPHWAKPPLTYWAIAAGLALAGDDAWGVRAYNIAAFALTVLAVAAIGAALWDAPTGWVAGLVYISSLFPAIGAASATADTLLALWVTLAVLAYARARRGARPRGWVCAMWLLFGIGFATKGPPALLPLLALIGFHVSARRPFRFADPLGIALFVAAGAWWYALEIARHPELARYFLGTEVVARNLSGDLHRNAQWYGPLVIYAPILLAAPGWWVADALRIARRERLCSWRRLAEAARSGTAAGLLLYWLAVPLVAFALARSRLPLYLLPLYPAIAIAIARGIGLEPRAGAARARVHRVAACSIAVLIALKGVAAQVPSAKDATRVYREAARAAGSDARFVLYREPKLHGFQFYAGRRAERLSATGSEPWADRSLDAALADAEPARAYAIVARDALAPEIEALLRAKAILFTRVPLTGRSLFVIPRPSASAAH